MNDGYISKKKKDKRCNKNILLRCIYIFYMLNFLCVMLLEDQNMNCRKSNHEWKNTAKYKV